MKLMRLLILRSMFLRKSRTLLTLFGIVLGVSALFAMNHVNEKAFSSLTTFFEGTSGKVQLEVKSASPGEIFPEEILDQVADTDGIRAAVPVLEVPALLKVEGEEEDPLSMGLLGAGQNGLTLYGINETLEKEVREYVLAEGRFFSGSALGKEILLVKDYAEEKGIALGDTVAIQTAKGTQEFKVAGLLQKEGAGFLNLGKAGFLSLPGLQNLMDMEGEISRIDLTTLEEAPSGEALNALKEKIQSLLGEQYAVTPPGGQSGESTEMLSGYQISLNFMAGIALFVGAFLIYNALSMTVSERKKEIGVLRCVGLTKGQTIRQILEEGLILGVLGAVFGILLGMVFAEGLSIFMERFLGQPVERGGYRLSGILSSMGVGVVVTLISAVLPALQGGRVSPLEALRATGKKREGRIQRFLWIPGILLLLVSAGILLANPFSYDVQFRLGSLTVFFLFLGATLMIPATILFWQFLMAVPFRLIFGEMGKLGTRNISRAKNRTMLTVAALMVGVSMIVATDGITGSFRKDLSLWMDSFLGGDVFVSSSLPVTLEIRKEMEALPETAYVSPMAAGTAYWLRGEIEEKVSLIGIDPETYPKVTSFVFSEQDTDEEEALRRFSSGRKIFISEASAAKHSLKVGDEMVLKTLEGPVSFEIAGILLDYSSQGLLVTGTLEELKTYFGIEEATSFSIKLREGEDPLVYVDQLKALLGEEYELLIESNRELKIQAETLMAQAFSMFDVLGLLSVLVAALGVLNTLTMSVLERTREIGMLRSMGMTRIQVVKMVLSEAGLLGVIGGILGLLLGLLLTYILISAMGVMSGYQLEFVLPESAMYTSILVAFVTSILAAVLPARKAARIPVLSAIQYE